MISRATWYLREAFKKVWVRVVGFAALARLSAGLARVLSPYLPEGIALQRASAVVADLLGVLTSSMLAVTTFSLAIAVSPFAVASGSATPRATILLQEDRTTQNVLATFLGAFLFGLVGLIALHANFYDASGKVVVFLFTAAVFALVVLALIRWIDHLMRFGQMGDTLDRVEVAATAALNARLDNPYLGGRPLTGAPPEGCTAVSSTETGYVRHIDMQALQDCAEDLGAHVYVHRLPGAFVSLGEPLLFAGRNVLGDDQAAALRRAFAIGKQRNFEGDPRFGLIVLSEIASRALSPAVNDPGTAIDILGRLVRVLSRWRGRERPEIRFPNVSVPPITADDVMEDAFRPIARDGAALVEVQLRLQKALASLHHVVPDVFAEPAARMARDALDRSEAASVSQSDLAEIRAAGGLAISGASPARNRAPEIDSGSGAVAPEI